MTSWWPGKANEAPRCDSGTRGEDMSTPNSQAPNAVKFGKREMGVVGNKFNIFQDKQLKQIKKSNLLHGNAPKWQTICDKEILCVCKLQLQLSSHFACTWCTNRAMDSSGLAPVWSDGDRCTPNFLQADEAIKSKALRPGQGPPRCQL